VRSYLNSPLIVYELIFKCSSKKKGDKLED